MLYTAESMSGGEHSSGGETGRVWDGYDYGAWLQVQVRPHLGASDKRRKTERMSEVQESEMGQTVPEQEQKWKKLIMKHGRSGRSCAYR